MFTFLFLQRRRLAFGAFFFFLSGLLMFENGGITGILGLSVLFMLICTTLAAIGIYFFPAYRQVWEIVGITFLGMRAIEALDPPFLAGLPVIEGAWSIVLICLGYTLLFHAIYGAWWEKTSLSLRYLGVSRVRATVLPEKAWRHIVPDEADPGRYYSGTLAAYETPGDDPAHKVQKLRVGRDQFIEIHTRVLEDDGGHRFAYGSADPETGEAVDGFHWALTLRPAPMGSTDITVIEDNDSLPVNHALHCWFDDLGGQTGHSMQRFLEGRRDPTLLAWLRRDFAKVA